MNTQEQIAYLENELEKHAHTPGPLRDGLQQKLLELHMQVLNSGLPTSSPLQPPPAADDSPPPEASKASAEEVKEVSLPPSERDAPPYPDHIPREARKVGPEPNLLGAEDKRVTEEAPKTPAPKTSRRKLPKGEYTEDDIPPGWLTLKQWLATEMNIPVDELSQSLGTSFSMHCRPLIEKIPYFMTGEGKRMMTRQYYYPPAIKNYLPNWYDEWLAKKPTLQRLRQENLVPLPPKFGMVSFMGWMLGNGQPLNKVQSAANMFYDWMRDNWSKIKRADRVKLDAFEKGDFPQHINGRWTTKQHLEILYVQYYRWLADKAGQDAFDLLDLSKAPRNFGASPVPVVPYAERAGVTELLQQIASIDIDGIKKTVGEDKAHKSYQTQIKILISDALDVSTGVALKVLREILATKLDRHIALRAQKFRWSEYCQEYLDASKSQNGVLSITPDSVGVVQHLPPQQEC